MGGAEDKLGGILTAINTATGLIVTAQLLSRQSFNFMQFFYCSFRKNRSTCQSWVPSLTTCPGCTIRCITVIALKLQTGALHLQLEASGSCRNCLTDLTPTVLQFYFKKNICLSASGLIQAPAATITLMDPVGSLSNE